MPEIPRTTHPLSPAGPSTVDRSQARFADGTRDTTGELGQDAFMRLLIAQMQHQDPTAPADSTQMMTQMAQFSSVENLTGVNKKLTGIGSGQEFSSAVALIGRTVDYTDAGGRAVSGTVDGVEQDAHGVLLRIGSARIETGQIGRVH